MRIVFRDFEETKYLIIGNDYEVIAIFNSYADAEAFINYYDKRLTA